MHARVYHCVHVSCFLGGFFVICLTFGENMADSKEYVGLLKKQENFRKHGQDNQNCSDFSMTPFITQQSVQESQEKDQIHKWLFGFSKNQLSVIIDLQFV